MATGHASMLALTMEHIRALELLGEHLRAELRLLAGKHKVELTIGGFGSLISFSFGREPLHNYRDTASLIEHRRKVGLFHRLLLDRGILIASQGLAVLSTAMDRAEGDLFLAAVDGSLAKLA
jgi:glutamate-1-semialdehyde 2,1-aminomutase